MRRAKERGTAFLEFIIYAPLLLLFSLHTYEVANILYHHAVLTNLSREAARYASSVQRVPYDLQPLVSTRVNQLYSGGNSPTWRERLNFSGNLTTATITTNGDVRVVITGTYGGLIFPWNRFRITATSTVPKL